MKLKPIIKQNNFVIIEGKSRITKQQQWNSSFYKFNISRTCDYVILYETF